MLAGGGFLVYYVLLPGQEAKTMYGHGNELQFLNLTRHQWADIHLILAFVFISLLLLHIILHWKMIVTLTQKYCTKNGGKIVLAVLLILSILIIVLPFFVAPQVVQNPKMRNFRSSNINETSMHIPIADEQKIASTKNIDLERTQKKALQKKELQKKQYQTNEKSNHSNIERPHRKNHNEAWKDKIKGNHTLAEACEIAGISVNQLCKRLQIPENQKNERLGHLKKKLRMELNEIKDIMSEVKNK